MTVRQISIFLENSPGKLQGPVSYTHLLGESDAFWQAAVTGSPRTVASESRLQLSLIHIFKREWRQNSDHDEGD